MNNTQTITKRPYSLWRDGISHLWHFAKGVLGLIFHHPVTGTSIIPILDDGRLVLIRRRDTGQWALPDGMVQWEGKLPRQSDALAFTSAETKC